MRLKKLILKNIRSYENHEIVFPDNSVLLSGDVGSGKTSILLAIEYALFGLQPGQKGSALLRNSANLGEVSLELEIDGQQIIIERRLRRSNSSVTNEYSAITINGEKTESSITEVKTQILQLLNYPPEFIKKNNLLYRYTVYTPQEQMKQIILEDSETRLNVLRHIFGVDKYKRIRENLTIFLNYLKEESKLLQGEIKNLNEEKNKKDFKESLIKDLEIKIFDSEKRLNEKVLQRKKAELEVIELENKLQEKQIFEKEVEKTNILISTKKENLHSIIKDTKEIVEGINEIGTTFNQIDYDFIAKSLNEKGLLIEQLNSQYIKVISNINTIEKFSKDKKEQKERLASLQLCPFCLQIVSDTHRHSIIHDIDSTLSSGIKNIESLKIEKENLLREMEKARTDKISLESKKLNLEVLKSKMDFVQKSKNKIEENVKSQTSLEKDIDFLIKHITLLKESILKFSKFDKLHNIKVDELKRAFVNEKNSEIQLAELKKELQITRKEISEIVESIALKELTKEKLNLIMETMDWLSTSFLNLIDFTERNIMMKLRIEFSELFSKWFHLLAGESFEVRLDETFTPLIMQGEVEMEYSFLSGGERTALALAYRLALNQTVNSILSQIKTRDIVILDEPTEGFSDIQIDKMRDVFQELNVDQLIIVSHEQKIESFVDHVIKIRKSDTTSTIEQIIA